MAGKKSKEEQEKAEIEEAALVKITGALEVRAYLRVLLRVCSCIMTA